MKIDHHLHHGFGLPLGHVYWKEDNCYTGLLKVGYFYEQEFNGELQLHVSRLDAFGLKLLPGGKTPQNIAIAKKEIETNWEKMWQKISIYEGLE